jgi:hypothetical protein
MNSQKATYFLALALTAFAFHSEYQRGAFPVVHRAANSAGATLCRMATHAERTVAMARLMAARPTISDDELRASLELRQFADTRQLSEDQKEMVWNQVRAQQEVVRAQVREYRSQVREYRGQIRNEMRSLPTQVRLADSMKRRVLVVGPGNCKTRVEVPALPAADDDDDTF